MERMDKEMRNCIYEETEATVIYRPGLCFEGHNRSHSSAHAAMCVKLSVEQQLTFHLFRPFVRLCKHRAWWPLPLPQNMPQAFSWKWPPLVRCYQMLSVVFVFALCFFCCFYYNTTYGKNQQQIGYILITVWLQSITNYYRKLSKNAPRTFKRSASVCRKRLVFLSVVDLKKIFGFFI